MVENHHFATYEGQLISPHSLKWKGKLKKSSDDPSSNLDRTIHAKLYVSTIYHLGCRGGSPKMGATSSNLRS